MQRTRGSSVGPVFSQSIGLPAIITDFYREEFLKHQEVLRQQREYYSEHAITQVDAALKRTLAHIEQLCRCDNADQVMSDLLRKFDLVTNLSAWSDPKNAH